MSGTSLPPGAAGAVQVSMPEVVEAEIESTARIECGFSIPGNGSYTFIDWFYVSARGLGGGGCPRGSPSACPCPLVPQVDRGSPVKLLRLAGGEVLEEETSYKGRLSVGEDAALAISRVTPQDARTFVCRVGAGSQDVGENRTELRVYSECRAARGRGASRPPRS